MNPTNYPNPSYDEQKYDDIFGKLDMAVVEKRLEIEDFATTHPHMVLRADTGSGKSLAFPIELLEVQERLGQNGLGKIGLIEPRKDTTQQNAENIANIYGATKPEKVRQNKDNEIGYQMRGDNRRGSLINAMTDGYLIELIKQHPLLEEYWAVVFDEKHENTWNQDFGMAFIKEIVNPKRIAAGMQPIRLSAVSATIDAQKESQYLTNGEDSSAIFDIKVERKYQITSEFLQEPIPKTADHLQKTAEKVVEIIDIDDGDIFVFIEGTAEIEKTEAYIETLLGSRASEFDILQLHAQMPQSEREKATSPRAPNGKRRITLTTNVGETGVTVKELTAVVDTGYIKEMQYDPATGADRLVTVPHSRSGLDQRAGRVGRESNGRYYGMYTEEDYLSRPEFPGHEIDKMNLMDAVLQMKGLGVPDVYNFNLPKRPEKAKLDIAIKELQNLRVLDENGNLTPDGEMIYQLGIGAERGRMILEGINNECLDEMVSIAALLADGRSPFIRPPRKTDNYRLHLTQARFNLIAGTEINPSSDPMKYLNAYEQYVQNNKNKDWAKDNYLSISALRNADEERTDILRRLAALQIPLVPSNFSNSENDPIKATEDKTKAIRKSVAAGMVNKLMYFDPKVKKYRNIFTNADEISPNAFSALPKDEAVFITSFGLTTAERKGQDTIANICQSVDPEWIPEFLPHLCKISNEKRYQNPRTGEQFRTYKAKLKNPPIDLGTVTEKLHRNNDQQTLSNPNASRVHRRNPILERSANPEQNARRLASNLAENNNFPPTEQNKTVLKQMRDLWLKLQGKL